MIIFTANDVSFTIIQGDQIYQCRTTQNVVHGPRGPCILVCGTIDIPGPRGPQLGGTTKM